MSPLHERNSSFPLRRAQNRRRRAPASLAQQVRHSTVGLLDHCPKEAEPSPGLSRPPVPPLPGFFEPVAMALFSNPGMISSRAPKRNLSSFSGSQPWIIALVSLVLERMEQHPFEEESKAADTSLPSLRSAVVRDQIRREHRASFTIRVTSHQMDMIVTRV